jgi:hypothetical protein
LFGLHLVVPDCANVIQWQLKNLLSIWFHSSFYPSSMFDLLLDINHVGAWVE